MTMKDIHVQVCDATTDDNKQMLATKKNPRLLRQG
jgi:hypothetical protein